MHPQQTPATPFTPRELLQLTVLRTQYNQEYDCFSRREHARLLFWRWLYQTGNLESAHRQ